MYQMIINPASCSGRGRQYWESLEKYLCQHRIPYTAHFSEKMGHITRITRDLTRKLDGDSQPLHIIVVGGDGSLNEALQGICNFQKVRFSYIPTGSGNDFARALNMAKDPVENLERILYSGSERAMDIGKATYDIGGGRFESRYFAVSCGLGFDAAVCEAVFHSSVKRLLNRIGLGKLIYLLHSLRLLACEEPVLATLTLEDLGQSADFNHLLFATGMNHKYEGGGFMFSPNANSADGFVDICLVADISRLKILRVLPTAFKGTHLKYKGVYAFHTKCYTITTKAPLWLQTDGEVLARTQALTVSCIPQLLHFYC